MESQLKARFILEILGAPKEHIVKKLKEHVDELKTQGLDIQLEKFEEAKEQEKLWSQFVELEIQFEKVGQLLNFCFDSMPSSVEILSPDKIDLNSAEFEDLLNDFQAKLHHADKVLKNIQAQKQFLDLNATNTFRNFIRYACSQGAKSAQELSELVGVGEDALQSFIDYLLGKNILKKEGEKYTTND